MISINRLISVMENRCVFFEAESNFLLISSFKWLNKFWLWVVKFLGTNPCKNCDVHIALRLWFPENKPTVYEIRTSVLYFVPIWDQGTKFHCITTYNTAEDGKCIFIKTFPLSSCTQFLSNLLWSSILPPKNDVRLDSVSGFSLNTKLCQKKILIKYFCCLSWLLGDVLQQIIVNMKWELVCYFLDIFSLEFQITEIIPNCDRWP